MIINMGNINFGGSGGGGGEYHLPVATATRLGGIKVGSGLTITNDGILSSEGSGGAGDALVPVSELPASAETGEVVAYQYTVTGNTPHNYSIDEQDGSHFGFVVEYLDPETYHTSENPMHLGRIVSPNASGLSGDPNYLDLYLYYDNTTTPPTFKCVDSNGNGNSDYLQPRTELYFELDGPYIQQDDNQILINVAIKAAINDGVITVGITGESTDSSAYQSDLELVDGIEEGGEPYSNDYVEVRQYDGTQWVKGLAHFTAATDSDMEALAANDGDVCYVADHYGPVNQLWEDLFNNNWSLQDVAGNYRGTYSVYSIKLTLVENPYWDGANEYVDAYDNWEKDGAAYGFSSTTENGGSFYCFSGSSTPVVMTTGDSMVIDTEFMNFGYSNDFYLFEHSNNTTPKYVLKAEQIVKAASYFNQNGSWIKIASEDKVNEAIETAQNALNQAASKLNYSNIGYTNESDVLPNIKYTQTGVFDVTIWSQPRVEKGLLFHKYGSDTEEDNKYLRELVTSKSVMKIVALTQSEYDALEQAGQLVSTTLYAIIPEQV